MIEITIRISGKFQVEIESDYGLDREQGHKAYTIETYAFIPGSLGINTETYPKYLFYRDTQTYIQFDMPVVLLSDIAADDSSTFGVLEQSLENLVDRKTTAASLLDCENQIRLFCCTVKYSIENHRELVREAATPADAEHLVEYYHAHIITILRRFRQIGQDINLSSIDERLHAVYLYADEYNSIFSAQYAFDMLEITRKYGGDNTQGYRAALLALIRDEEKYRAGSGYPSVLAKGEDNEGYIYRRGMLKRMMESILFLDTRVKPEGRITEQVVFSLAAGVAMMFATAVAFLTQQKYGNFTMAFFVALVVSYMFKDRIKELARLYFNTKIRGRYFDQKINIYGGSRGNRLGYTRESFRFVSEGGLPQEINRIRNRDAFIRINRDQLGEKIFVYRKQLKIISRHFERVYHSTPVDGLTDIWRINLARFARKMDNPKKPVFILNDEGYRQAKASKVYHINLVIKYVTAHDEHYKRFRVIMNRNGIKRIEQTDSA